jgi:hypothetical protein
LPLILDRTSGAGWPSGERRVAELSLAAALSAWIVGAWPLSGIDLAPLGNLVGFPRWRITTVVSYALPVIALAVLYVARRRLAFGLGVAAFAAICAWDNEQERPAVYQQRSFYSVLSVRDNLRTGCRTLWSETTPHGRQTLTPEGRRQPLLFYHPDSRWAR